MNCKNTGEVLVFPGKHQKQSAISFVFLLRGSCITLRAAYFQKLPFVYAKLDVLKDSDHPPKALLRLREPARSTPDYAMLPWRYPAYRTARLPSVPRDPEAPGPSAPGQSRPSLFQAPQGAHAPLHPRNQTITSNRIYARPCPH